MIRGVPSVYFNVGSSRRGTRGSCSRDDLCKVVEMFAYVCVIWPIGLLEHDQVKEEVIGRANMAGGIEHMNSCVG